MLSPGLAGLCRKVMPRWSLLRCPPGAYGGIVGRHTTHKQEAAMADGGRLITPASSAAICRFMIATARVTTLSWRTTESLAEPTCKKALPLLLRYARSLLLLRRFNQRPASSTQQPSSSSFRRASSPTMMRFFWSSGPGRDDWQRADHLPSTTEDATATTTTLLPAATAASVRNPPSKQHPRRCCLAEQRAVISQNGAGGRGPGVRHAKSHFYFFVVLPSPSQRFNPSLCHSSSAGVESRSDSGNALLESFLVAVTSAGVPPCATVAPVARGRRLGLDDAARSCLLRGRGGDGRR